MEKFQFPGNSLLFYRQNSTFTCQFVTNALRTLIAPRTAFSRLRVEENYSGHSFCRRAATPAKEAVLSNAEIQLLGRWKSNSYWFYIDLGFDKLWNISWRHLRLSSTWLLCSDFFLRSGPIIQLILYSSLSLGLCNFLAALKISFWALVYLFSLDNLLRWSVLRWFWVEFFWRWYAGSSSSKCRFCYWDSDATGIAVLLV